MPHGLAPKIRRNLFGRLLGFRQISAHHHHVSSRARQTRSHRLPQSLRAAGDDRRFSA